MVLSRIAGMLGVSRFSVAVAVFTVIGVLGDRLILHPLVFMNEPAASYYLVKLLIVGGVAWLAGTAINRVKPSTLHYRLHYGFVIGIIALQLYYAFYPVELVTGEAVQVGLVNSLLVGLPVHAGVFLVPLVLIGLPLLGDAY